MDPNQQQQQQYYYTQAPVQPGSVPPASNVPQQTAANTYASPVQAQPGMAPAASPFPQQIAATQPGFAPVSSPVPQQQMMANAYPPPGQPGGQPGVVPASSPFQHQNMPNQFAAPVQPGTASMSSPVPQQMVANPYAPQVQPGAQPISSPFGQQNMPAQFASPVQPGPIPAQPGFPQQPPADQFAAPTGPPPGFTGQTSSGMAYNPGVVTAATQTWGAPPVRRKPVQSAVQPQQLQQPQQQPQQPQQLPQQLQQPTQQPMAQQTGYGQPAFGQPAFNQPSPPQPGMSRPGSFRGMMSSLKTIAQKEVRSLTNIVSTPSSSQYGYQAQLGSPRPNQTPNSAYSQSQYSYGTQPSSAGQYWTSDSQTNLGATQQTAQASAPQTYQSPAVGQTFSPQTQSVQPTQQSYAGTPGAVPASPGTPAQYYSQQQPPGAAPVAGAPNRRPVSTQYFSSGISSPTPAGQQAPAPTALATAQSPAPATYGYQQPGVAPGLERQNTAGFSNQPQQTYSGTPVPQQAAQQTPPIAAYPGPNAVPPGQTASFNQAPFTQGYAGTPAPAQGQQIPPGASAAPLSYQGDSSTPGPPAFVPGVPGTPATFNGQGVAPVPAEPQLASYEPNTLQTLPPQQLPPQGPVVVQQTLEIQQPQPKQPIQPPTAELPEALQSPKSSPAEPVPVQQQQQQQEPLQPPPAQENLPIQTPHQNEAIQVIQGPPLQELSIAQEAQPQQPLQHLPQEPLPAVQSLPAVPGQELPAQQPLPQEPLSIQQQQPPQVEPQEPQQPQYPSQDQNPSLIQQPPQDPSSQQILQGHPPAQQSFQPQHEIPSGATFAPLQEPQAPSPQQLSQIQQSVQSPSGQHAPPLGPPPIQQLPETQYQLSQSPPSVPVQGVQAQQSVPLQPPQPPSQEPLPIQQPLQFPPIQHLPPQHPPPNQQPPQAQYHVSPDAALISNQDVQAQQPIQPPQAPPGQHPQYHIAPDGAPVPLQNVQPPRPQGLPPFAAGAPTQHAPDAGNLDRESVLSQGIAGHPGSYQYQHAGAAETFPGSDPSSDPPAQQYPGTYGTPVHQQLSEHPPQPSGESNISSLNRLGAVEFQPPSMPPPPGAGPILDRSIYLQSYAPGSAPIPAAQPLSHPPVNYDQGQIDNLAAGVRSMAVTDPGSQSVNRAWIEDEWRRPPLTISDNGEPNEVWWDCSGSSRDVIFEATWFHLPDVPDFVICTRCHDRFLKNTALAPSFEKSVRSDVRCRFNVPRITSVKLPQALEQGNVTPLKEYMAERIGVKDCTQKTPVQVSVGQKWYAIAGETNDIMVNFRCCEACYLDIAKANKSYAEEFRPIEQPEGSAWLCDLAIQHTRRTLIIFSRNNAPFTDWVERATKRYQLPHCDGKPVESCSREWYRPKDKVEGMVICEQCYLDLIAWTAIEDGFEQIPVPKPVTHSERMDYIMGHRQEKPTEWVCDAKTDNIWLLLEGAVKKQDAALFSRGSRIIFSNPPCVPQGISNGEWYTLKGGNENFIVCSSCVTSCFEAFDCAPFLEKHPLSGNPNTYLCTMNPSSPRYNLFSLCLYEAQMVGVWSRFANAIREFIDLPVCARDEHVPNRKWYGWHDCLICPECYKNVCKDTKGSLQFEVEDELIADLRMCCLYSPRMRAKWMDACQKGDATELLEFSRQRHQVYARTVPQIKMLRGMQDMQMMTAMSNGYAGMMYQGAASIQSVSGSVDGNLHGNSTIGWHDTENGAQSAELFQKMNDGMRGANSGGTWGQIFQLAMQWDEWQ